MELFLYLFGMSTSLSAPIHQWAVDDRPREKLNTKGPESLSDAELIAILIGSGNRNQSAVELAKHILRESDNNLNQLGKRSVRALMKYRGIGEAKAITIAAAMELGRRRKQLSVQLKHIESAETIFELFQPQFQDLEHEEFWIVLLNRANHFLAEHCISKGGIHGTVADIRLIFRHALEAHATSIIMIHNHPSGRLRPSKADIDLTEKAKQSGLMLDIPLIDHVIIGATGFYSFADEGLL